MGTTASTLTKSPPQPPLRPYTGVGMGWQMSRWVFILALAGVIPSPGQTVKSRQSVLRFFVARDSLVDAARPRNQVYLSGSAIVVPAV